MISFLLLTFAMARSAFAEDPPSLRPSRSSIDMEVFSKTIKPFLDKYCVSCHGKETRKAVMNEQDIYCRECEPCT
mgnify:CR=1 FL=1